jgi:hypothetical protein
MHVQMKNGLSAVAVCIYDDPVTVISKPFLTCQSGTSVQQMPDQGFIGIAGSIERIDMISRDYKNVRWRLRVKVVERNALFVLVNSVGRNFTRNDLAENAILRAHQFDQSI